MCLHWGGCGGRLMHPYAQTVWLRPTYHAWVQKVTFPASAGIRVG